MCVYDSFGTVLGQFLCLYDSFGGPPRTSIIRVTSFFILPLPFLILPFLILPFLLISLSRSTWLTNVQRTVRTPNSLGRRSIRCGGTAITWSDRNHGHHPPCSQELSRYGQQSPVTQQGHFGQDLVVAVAPPGVGGLLPPPAPLPMALMLRSWSGPLLLDDLTED